MEFLKTIILGIIEGITEWLPVSSTGHMIVAEDFLKLNVSESFWEMFLVVIQLGAIMAVICMYFHKLNPFSPKKSKTQKKATWDIWGKVIVGVLPAAVLGFLLDDWMDEHLYNFVVVAIALIIYGVAFIFVEQKNKGKAPAIKNTREIDYRTAILIGCFQCLSLIPGTSRSGSTILGAILLGVGRSAGAEFSFFLAIPTMLGASALKLLKFLLSGVSVTGTEVGVLLVGCVVSFLVSFVVIRGLMEYVRKHSFRVFGLYRIGLGILVLIYFVIKSIVT
jgi:undecaprenyl-diphosphatase